MKSEVWKDVVGFVGAYKVSDAGRVLDVKTNRIRTLSKDKDGYHCIMLSKNGKRVSRKVHRLVAEAFIENPDVLPCINHKNEIKTDNRPENLEWCTRAYNNSYGSKVRCVVQTDLSGRFLAKYSSISDAARKNKLDFKTLYRWCRKNGGIGHGSMWYFEDCMTGG